MSNAKPLKRRLAALEAEAAKCADLSERERLKQKADRLRKDLEQAGYLSQTNKRPKRSKSKQPNRKKTQKNVDPLVRAKNSPGFAGVRIRFVQGGSARGK